MTKDNIFYSLTANIKNHHIIIFPLKHSTFKEYSYSSSPGKKSNFFIFCSYMILEYMFKRRAKYFANFKNKHHILLGG